MESIFIREGGDYVEAFFLVGFRKEKFIVLNKVALILSIFLLGFTSKTPLNDQLFNSNQKSIILDFHLLTNSVYYIEEERSDSRTVAKMITGQTSNIELKILAHEKYGEQTILDTIGVIDKNAYCLTADSRTIFLDRKDERNEYTRARIQDILLAWNFQNYFPYQKLNLHKSITLRDNRKLRGGARIKYKMELTLNSIENNKAYISYIKMVNHTYKKNSFDQIERGNLEYEIQEKHFSYIDGNNTTIDSILDPSSEKLLTKKRNRTRTIRIKREDR